MHIKVFELRKDERDAFARACAALPKDVICDAEEHALTYGTADDSMEADAVVIAKKSTLDERLLERMAAHGVKYVATRTIGYNHIDVDVAKRLGIRVCNTTYPPYGVAEFAIMLMLMALRHCKPALWRQQVNDYTLDGLQGRELRTLTVGVMGTGRIGCAVIDCLRGFGCSIVAYDPYPNEELSSSGAVRYVSLEELYRLSDLITVHIPLTDAARGIIDAEAVDKMREGVVIVNVSRGELVDIPAVTKGIEERKIGALAMDVFPGEDGIYYENRTTDILANRDMAYLRQFPNVILTQHIAFYTDVDVDGMVEQGIGGVIAMESGSCATEL